MFCVVNLSTLLCARAHKDPNNLQRASAHPSGHMEAVVSLDRIGSFQATIHPRTSVVKTDTRHEECEQGPSVLMLDYLLSEFVDMHGIS